MPSRKVLRFGVESDQISDVLKTVIKIKNGENSLIYELYNKYMPLIKSIAYKASQSQGGCSYVYEDMIQEGYLCVCETINYIDLEKVFSSHNLKSWGIGKLLRYFLLNVAYKKSFRSIYLEKKDSNIYNLEDYAENIISSPTLVDDEVIVNVDYSLTKMKGFFSQLSSDQRDIIRLRRRGQDLKTISQSYGKAKSWVHFHIYKSKMIASNYFDISFDSIYHHRPRKNNKEAIL